jgi:hypothetical protein
MDEHAADLRYKKCTSNFSLAITGYIEEEIKESFKQLNNMM